MYGPVPHRSWRRRAGRTLLIVYAGLGAAVGLGGCANSHGRLVDERSRKDVDTVGIYYQPSGAVPFRLEQHLQFSSWMYDNVEADQHAQSAMTDSLAQALTVAPQTGGASLVAVPVITVVGVMFGAVAAADDVRLEPVELSPDQHRRVEAALKAASERLAGHGRAQALAAAERADERLRFITVRHDGDRYLAESGDPAPVDLVLLLSDLEIHLVGDYEAVDPPLKLRITLGAGLLEANQIPDKLLTTRWRSKRHLSDERPLSGWFVGDGEVLDSELRAGLDALMTQLTDYFLDD